jgi:hypothetical protein
VYCSTSLAACHRAITVCVCVRACVRVCHRICEVHSDVDKAASQPRVKTFPFRTVSYQTSYCQQVSQILGCQYQQVICSHRLCHMSYC